MADEELIGPRPIKAQYHSSATAKLQEAEKFELPKRLKKKMAATSDEEMESLLSAFDQIYEVLESNILYVLLTFNHQ